jgi:hypothetical protein
MFVAGGETSQPAPFLKVGEIVLDCDGQRKLADGWSDRASTQTNCKTTPHARQELRRVLGEAAKSPPPPDRLLRAKQEKLNSCG